MYEKQRYFFEQYSSFEEMVQVSKLFFQVVLARKWKNKFMTGQDMSKKCEA